MRRTRIGFLIVALFFSFGSLFPVAAQDATPGVSPMGGECIAPQLPPGTPTPMEEMVGMGEPAASPEGDAAMPMDATPEADESEMMMPPMPEPIMGGEPADEATAAEVEEAVHNIANCLNAGMYLEVAALYTENELMEECGTANPYDAEFCYEGIPPIEVLSVENARVHDDGRVSAEATYRIGSMLRAEQFVFVREDDTLLLDTSPELPVEAPEGATVIEGEMVDYAFELSETSAPAGDIVFDVTNTGEYPHELVVVALPEGVTVEDVLEDESLFPQVQFFGYTYSEAGDDAPPLVLLDMEPGSYTLVCFIDVPEGIPHVMRGMVLDFEVTEP